MDQVIAIIGKVFDFLGKQDYAKIFDTIEKVLVKIVEWIGSLAA